jgi:Membrane protein involved in colicin uptake
LHPEKFFNQEFYITKQMRIKYFLMTLSFCLSFFVFAQPKLEETWKDNHLNETLETPLGFLRKEKTTVNKVDYSLGVDKNNKIKYIETNSPTFKVEGYSLATKLFGFKNYTYTRFFEGWGYYLRVNASWCAFFGKAKPTKDTRPIFFFNYNFGKAEGKPIFDSAYEDVLAAQVKAEREKAEKKAKEKEEQARRKAEYERETERLEKEKAAKEKAELERKQAIQREVEKRRAEEEAKKKAEEEAKQQYAKEVAEYNAKKEAEKKAKEEERKRKSEEFRTGQRVINTELAQGSSSTTATFTESLQGGEKILNETFKLKLKKSLRDYQNYINKNQKRTEAYPLVLVNYKDIMEYSQSELSKITKITSTTVFKKGTKRTEDFKEKGMNGVVIIKVEFSK